MRNRVSIIVPCLFLAGCAAHPRCPPIPGGPEYCLQSTHAVPAFSALQELRIRRQDMDERLIARLEVDAEGMRLVALTPMGQRILEARFDNVEASASSLAGGKVDARALLSLAQLAAWPGDTVRSGLGEGWQLEEATRLRRVTREGLLSLEIRTQGSAPNFSAIELFMPQAEMTVNLKTVMEADDAP